MPNKVLIVDDEEMARINLSTHFEDMGYLVAEAADGREGLAAFHKEQPDIVLTDLRMPVMDGLTFIANLREINQDIPIIVMSGIGTLQNAIEAVRLGACDYLTKPIQEAGKLDITVKRALERAQLIADNRRYRKNLEELVQQRTSQLEMKQGELQIRNEELKGLLSSLQKGNEELEAAYSELKSTQSQLLQQEKMASIGQLAAGIAHEINNPVGFIASNLGTLGKYSERLSEYIGIIEGAFQESRPDQAQLEQVQTVRRRLKIDHIVKDLREIIKESIEGVDRVKRIVLDMKSFSRVDDAEPKETDINHCLASTLNIVWNELKYKATVKPEFGELPLIRCHPQQLNQVFMNLLVNAGQAIEREGEISIRTWHADSRVFVSVSDTGCGIPEEIRQRIFEPFFTTKEVGKGTGLGLSISFDIIRKHGGTISVESKPGEGTTFTVSLPYPSITNRP